MKRFTLFALILSVPILTSRVFGQQPDTVTSLPGIHIETSVDLAEAYIGDLITYKVVIEYDSAYELIPPPLGANLGAFDVKDYQPDVASTLEGGRLRSENTFVLSTFTTGDYIIPPVPVAFKARDGQIKLLLSEPVPIKIKSLLLNSDDSAVDIRPLKAQAEFPQDKSLTYWIVGGGILLLGIGAFLWWRLRKRKLTGEPVDTREPWEIASDRLVRLSQRDLIANGKEKEYYGELSEVVRWYLGRMYERDILEMTTEETLEVLREIDLPGTIYVDVSAFLKHADLVKFAEYKPVERQAQSDLDFVHRLIEVVRAEHFRLRAAAVKQSPQQPVGAA